MNEADRAALTLVRRVSEAVILPRYRNLAAGEIVEKASDDLVTISAREAEEMLAEGLAAIDPSLAIVGEEIGRASCRERV